MEPTDLLKKSCDTFQTRVYNGKVDPCGAVHITIGDGGNREGLAQR